MAAHGLRPPYDDCQQVAQSRLLSWDDAAHGMPLAASHAPLLCPVSSTGGFLDRRAMNNEEDSATHHTPTPFTAYTLQGS